LQDGKLNYYHSVLTPVVAQPGNEHVIALEVRQASLAFLLG